MSKKVLIVGGVAGGASTAARLRRLDETAEIIMFEKGEHISFANCGLPYYIGGTIEQRDALLVQTPEKMKSKFNIDVRVKNEVLSIDREKKEVKVKDLNSGKIYKESYDYLVLSPGASPIKPPIPGIDSPNIFTLRNIPDTDAIKECVDNKKPKRAVVVGGGFIGIEMAENLYDRGLEVSIVEMADQVMGPIDFDMAQIVHQHIKSKDVKLYLKDGVKEFEYKDGITKVTLQSGKTLDADIVILAIGVRPDSKLAMDCGLEVNQRGGIIVDEYLRTSDKNIFAIGDAIEVVDFVNGAKTMIPLAGPANKQGRIVANNIAGRLEKYKGTQGTSIAKVFDLTVASTGNNEKILNRMGKKYGKDYKIALIHSKSHAGYYPGAIPMTIKLIFNLKGKILGAQIVGYDGVDKRIDVIASAIRFGGTIYDLKELELAYAPPYSSAKDPVNMVGFTAENILKRDVDVIMCNELEKLDKNEVIILDVRDEIERELGYIEGSINIPLDELRNRLNELDKEKLIIPYCAIGLRGYLAARILKQNGFKKVKNLSGGYTTYSCIFCQDEASKCGGVTFDLNADFNEGGEPEEIDINNLEGKTIKLNACGLQCPGPVMQVYEKMKALENGDILEVTATDPGFVNDIKNWCKRTGNTLIKTEKRPKEFVAFIRKGRGANIVKDSSNNNVVQTANDGKTIIVFSGDLDKAIASFIIANGAAAMGRKVTMFFTFWGLNILRKPEKVKVEKGLMDKMFGMMMPRGSKKLKLSQMNMMGIGAKMIRSVMKKKNISSLEELMEKAKKQGIRLVACNMSMDVMGITREELIDGVEIGGVASYLGAAEESNVNLFI
ncbi:pyridine nucleotide-disulfide oxidoreductase [Caloranaerobacter sp. TR13]|uniref:CoA-disulfide reductase n=1 Tax=Caloranaerobacter sp. TR13 TaxID=1302151 RepID=UPI0006D493F2|nr:CoA-disulfide reductase [Caloranaerobacter sp. TR13]KPU27241.1 pyridine nucleotide-disulfide oxidoreductase [Caloranaerobacter sp. TR13]